MATSTAAAVAEGPTALSALSRSTLAAAISPLYLSTNCCTYQPRHDRSVAPIKPTYLEAVAMILLTLPAFHFTATGHLCGAELAEGRHDRSLGHVLGAADTRV